MQSTTRSRLLAGAALGLGLAVFTPTQAQAACTLSAVPGGALYACATNTTTTDTTTLTNPPNDRNVDFNVSVMNLDVDPGVLVDGFGLALTEIAGGGAAAVTAVNDGTIQVNAGNTPTAGGSAALDISVFGATTVNYSGAGDIFNLGTGDGLNIDTSGTGNITANVGGSVTSVADDAINIENSGTAGNITVTTVAGETLRADEEGIEVSITNAASAGTVNITNAATILSPTGAPGTLGDAIDVDTAGTGAITVANSGTIGSSTDRAASGFELDITNAGSAAALSLTGTGAVWASDTALDIGNLGTGTTTVNYTGAVNTTGATGVDVDATSGATNVTLGAVTAATNAVDVDSTTGTQTITLNGVTTGTAGSGLVSDTTGARTITVGTAGNVTGGTQAILLTGTGTTTLGNSGTIGAAASPAALAINAAAAGATTVNNNTGGTINGRLTLSANADTFANQGTFNTQGITDFGAGADVFTNTGTLNLTGATTLANLETFNQSGTLNLNTFVLTGPAIAFTNSGTIDTNGNAGLAGFTTFSNAGTLNLAPGTFTVPAATFTNSGTILADEGASTISGQTSFANTGTLDLQDGVPDDTLTINSSFVGSGGSSLLVDYLAGDSDTLVITGAASGTTTIGAAYLGGGLDFDGSLVVDAASATTNAFVLGTVTGETPLVDVQLVQDGSDFFLVALPTEAAFNPLVVPGFAADIWYQSADEVFAETVKPATTEGISFWGNGYISRDTRGDDSDFDFDVDVDDFDVDFDLDGSQKTKRHGLQMGVDYGFGGGRIGLTGGYGWAKANGDGDADVKAKGWNLGVYGQFGGVTGFHGEFLAKHDRYDGEFDDGVFDGEEFDIRATGVDGSLGYRFGFGGDGNIDVLAGLSHVRTKIDDISAFGFNYDMGKVTSTRGRAGVRAVFGGGLAPFVAGTVYREFNGDGDIDLDDGDEIFGIDTDGKATWVRLEAGLSGNDGPGPILAAWGDLGDRKGLGLRAGWRFGGRVAEAAPPPPPPAPYVAPPAPPPPATQTCPDGSVILATDACPPPPPPPPPPPEPERG